MLSILVSIVVLLMLLAVIVLVAILVTWGVVKSRRGKTQSQPIAEAVYDEVLPQEIIFHWKPTHAISKI